MLEKVQFIIIKSASVYTFKTVFQKFKTSGYNTVAKYYAVIYSNKLIIGKPEQAPH